MRWLVTGGAGFIGSHVVDAILNRDLGDVVVLDNYHRGSRIFLAQHDGDPRLRIIESDIRNVAETMAACRGVDVVIHLAAYSNVMGSEIEAQEACETNVLGTLNVLDAALSSGVQKLVFSSSREVYGDPDYLPVSEDAPLKPKNLYGASKAAGETYCAIFRQRGLDVRVLRLTNIYGPRDTGRVVPLWLQRAEASMPLEVFGGQQVLDLLWIDYAVDALLSAAAISDLPVPVNVGTGKGVPIVELAKRVIKETGSSSLISMLPARGEEVLGYTANVLAMQRLLHITPPEDPLIQLRQMLTSSRLDIARP